MAFAARQVNDHQLLNTVLQAANPPMSELARERFEYRRFDGTVIEVLQNAMPDGGRVLTYTDISELKRREEALVAASRAAEQANAAKTRFLATASHDLRQPIHALGLFFATLAEQVDNPETSPLIKQIEDSINAIDTMLNALLDISKLDAGVIHPQVGPVAIAGLLQRLDTEYQPVARVTGNALRVRPCKAIVQSDATMLERILRNLLSNALRYTSNGRVLVAARRHGLKLRFEVYDTGPGIPADRLDDVFLEFYQLGNPERDRHQGLGLGLAIVKRVASLLEHDVTVRSRAGARFLLCHYRAPGSATARCCAIPGHHHARPGTEGSPRPGAGRQSCHPGGDGGSARAPGAARSARRLHWKRRGRKWRRLRCRRNC